MAGGRQKKTSRYIIKNKRALGAKKEQQAADYLEQIGYQILCQNFYSRFGELDLIAREGETLVFCEVKYRKDRNAGDPVEAISPKKLYRMQQTAQYYCTKEQISEHQLRRFDAVCILGEEITLYRNITGF